MSENHSRACKSIGFALKLGSFESWKQASFIMSARLKAQERASLAFSVLQSLQKDDASLVAEAALRDGAGQPIAPLFNTMDEASFWADMASNDELKAYALACFNRMFEPDRVSFLDYVQRRDAA